MIIQTSATVFGGAPMEVREGCNVGGALSIGRVQGGWSEENTLAVIVKDFEPTEIFNTYRPRPTAVEKDRCD